MSDGLSEEMKGDLLLGPVQFNWFNNGFRVHFTWPFKQPRTVTLWQS